MDINALIHYERLKSVMTRNRRIPPSISSPIAQIVKQYTNPTIYLHLRCLNKRSPNEKHYDRTLIFCLFLTPPLFEHTKSLVRTTATRLFTCIPALALFTCVLNNSMTRRPEPGHYSTKTKKMNQLSWTSKTPQTNDTKIQVPEQIQNHTLLWRANFEKCIPRW